MTVPNVLKTLNLNPLDNYSEYEYITSVIGGQNENSTRLG